MATVTAPKEVSIPLRSEHLLPTPVLPVAVSYDPADNSTVTEARPIIRIEYDEAIDETSVGTDAIKVMEGANEISGIIQHTVGSKNSVLLLSFCGFSK